MKKFKEKVVKFLLKHLGRKDHEKDQKKGQKFKEDKEKEDDLSQECFEFDMVYENDAIDINLKIPLTKKVPSLINSLETIL